MSVLQPELAAWTDRRHLLLLWVRAAPGSTVAMQAMAETAMRSCSGTFVSAGHGVPAETAPAMLCSAARHTPVGHTHRRRPSKAGTLSTSQPPGRTTRVWPQQTVVRCDACFYRLRRRRDRAAGDGLAMGKCKFGAMPADFLSTMENHIGCSELHFDILTLRSIQRAALLT